MTEQQVKDFFQAIAKTDWNMSFADFKAKTGFVGQYAEDKWGDWRDLVNSCTEFDTATMAKILG